MTTTKRPPALYSACADAARELVENPPPVHGGVFTELDVVARAGSPDWTPDDWKQAFRQASQVCGLMFRTQRLARYGPVQLSDGTQDYVRIASKIAYADPIEGPDRLETPNGSFARLSVEDDTFGQQGRRRGINRNDLESWDHQKIMLPATRGTRGARRLRQLEQQVQELQAQREALNNRAAWLEVRLQQAGITP